MPLWHECSPRSSPRIRRPFRLRPRALAPGCLQVEEKGTIGAADRRPAPGRRQERPTVLSWRSVTPPGAIPDNCPPGTSPARAHAGNLPPANVTVPFSSFRFDPRTAFPQSPPHRSIAMPCSCGRALGSGANQCGVGCTFSRGSDGQCTKCGDAEGNHHGSSKYCFVSTTSPCPPPHVYGFALLIVASRCRRLPSSHGGNRLRVDREHGPGKKRVDQAFVCEGSDENSWQSRPRHAVLSPTPVDSPLAGRLQQT